MFLHRVYGVGILMLLASAVDASARLNFTNFDVPGASSTIPGSINENNEIAGYYGEGTTPVGINSKRYVAGFYTDHHRRQHGFFVRVPLHAR